MSDIRAQLEAWRQQNPGYFSGLKQALSRAEGTWRGGQPGYNVLFGGGQFKDLSRHPDTVVRTPGYASAAAGAYQMMPGTFAEAARALGLKDFSPESQDLAMLYLAKRRLDPIGGLASISKAGTLSPKIQSYLSPEWASFPTESGKSYYGQPVKKSEQIAAWFDEGARNAQSGGVARTAQSSGNAKSSSAEASKSKGLGLLNKFIELLGTSGSLKKFGPQSSTGGYDLPNYTENAVPSEQQELAVLLDAVRSKKAQEVYEQEANRKTLIELQNNAAAAEQAKNILIKTAINSFLDPSSLI